MAKINNAQVIQKLVDELKLYPSKDAIPTELAEKILPVFQINSEEITVKTPTANVVRDGISTVGTGDVTLYTTSATDQFYLTNIALSFAMDGDGVLGAWNTLAQVQVTIDGTARAILSLPFRMETDHVGSVHEAVSLNFQNPVKVDKSTNIVLKDPAKDGIMTSGTIVGYEE